MTTRPLRGTSPWRASGTAEVSYERPAPRQLVPYCCSNGHEFTVMFAAEAAAPTVWDCRCGKPAALAGTEPPAPSALGGVDRRGFARAEREHGLALVLQRRTVAELEAMLAERLAELRTGGQQ